MDNNLVNKGLHISSGTVQYRILNRFQPPSGEKIINRGLLYTFFKERIHRKLFIIQGKPGQGKSTLVKGVLSELNRPYLWYSIEEDDRECAAFLSHLLRGVYLILQKQDDVLDELTRPDELLDLLLNTLNKTDMKEFCIVLDNYQKIDDDESVREYLSLLLNNLPDNIHLYLITTQTPRIPLSRIRSEKQLAELDHDKLLFSDEEMTKLLRDTYNLSFDDALLKKLFSLLEGWVTGLVYLMEELSVKDEAEQIPALKVFLTKKRLPAIDRFFREEIFQALQPDERHLISRIGIFETISPDLLEAIIGDNDPMQLFSRRSDFFFLSLSNEARDEYTFHPLFSKFLEKQFYELDHSIQEQIHEAASEYYHKKDREKEIIHLLKAKKPDSAKTKFVEYADRLLKNGQYEKIQALLKQFTYQDKSEDPYLAFYHGIVSNLIKPFSSRKKLFSLLSTFREREDYDKEARIYIELLNNYFFYLESNEKVEELLSMAKTFIAAHGEKLSKDRSEVLQALLTLGHWWVYPDSEEAFEIALRAEETSFKFQDEEAFLSSRLVLAQIYIDRGEFNNARELMLKTEKLFEKQKANHPYRAFISFLLGDTFFYIGDLDAAIAQMEKALSRTSEGFAFRRFLELNLVTYYLYSENIDQAESYFDSIREKEIGQNLYVQYFWIYLIQMVIAYRNGDARRAEYYSNRLKEKENEPLLQMDYPFSYLVLSEVNIYLEQYTDAEEYLTKTLEESEKRNSPYPRASASALLGLLKYRTGDKKASKVLFKQMLEILEEHQFKNLDIGDPELIREIAKITGSPYFNNFHRLGRTETTIPIVNKESEYNLRFKTFGSFELYINEEQTPVTLLSRQKRVIDLLKLLIIFRKNGITKEIIYETFWPRYSYKSARDNLNTVVYRLRKILGEGNDYISTNTNTIKLKEGAYKTDVDDFLDFIEKGKQAEKKGDAATALEYYRKAAGIYKGDFMESGLYLDIIRDERENLKNKYKHLIFNTIKICLTLGDNLDALEWAKRLITVDPLCEPGYRLMMISSVLIGNRTEITRIYNRLNSKLQNDLGIASDTKTDHLKERLLSGTPLENSMWESETII
jgi:ATP/maltotriose-dependent transcriptional regulator MalT/DNA-binding SARP family transcriptional activator